MDALVEQNDISAQKRTGSNKRLVVYKPSFPDVVYKGPYAIDGSDTTYNNLYYREEALKAWGAKQIIYMSEVVEFDQFIYNVKSKKKVYAIVYPNLRGGIPESFEENVESWAPNYTYNVSTDRNNCDKLSNMKDPRKYFTKDVVRSLLFLYVLNAGDIGTYNIIVCNDEATIIDYEENRSDHIPDDDDIFFFFSKAPAKKFRDMTSDLVIEYLGELLDEMKELDLNVVDYSYQPKKLVLAKHKDMIRRMELLINTNELQSPRGKPVISNIQLEPVEHSELGQMVKKYRNTKTSQGFSDSLIKSALQKNIRRGNVSQAIACAFELQRFRLIDAYDIVHNMYNRLSIISCEDVTPSNLGVQAYLCGWNSLFVRSQGDKSWLPANSTLNPKDLYNNARLAAIVQYLCLLKKTRIGSHLWRGYTTDHGRERLIELGYEVEELDLANLTNEVDLKDFEGEKVPYLQKSDFKIGDGTFALCLIVIHNRLRDHDFNAIAWIDYFRKTFLAEKPVIKVTKRHGRMRCDVILWDIYRRFIPDEIINPIMEMYYQISDVKTVDDRKALLATMAVRILMRSEDGMIEADLNKVSNIIDRQTAKWSGSDSLVGFVNGEVEIVIEDYMADKHTGKKGNADQLRQQFVLEGAKVMNQDEDYYLPDFKEIYEM